jgi:spore maturation protein CgeB
MSEAERTRIGERARAKVLAAHTSTHRAIELENHVRRARGGCPRPRIIHSYG